MAKRHRTISRGLILITLVVAACSFVIGLSWPSDQPVQQTMTERDSLSQTSPVIPIPQEIGSNPVVRRTGTPSVRRAQESELFPARPKPNATTQPDSLNSDIRGDNATTQPESLNPDIRGDSATPPVEAVKEQPVEVAGEEIPAGEQPAETFSVPTKFKAKIVKNVIPLGKEKVIALTFDDGPWPRITSQVLDILKKNEIKATFFWIGQNLQAYPKIAQQVVTNGHAIGNHTWHHWYRWMNQSTAAHEIEDTAELIYKTTGIRTSIFRPPGGVLNNGVADYAEKKNYTIAMWSVDSIDYHRPSAQKLVNNVIRKVQPGGIVLMHDGGGNRSTTVKALPQIIAQLKEQGYSFVTVPELLEMNDEEQSGITAKKQLSDSPPSPTTKP